MPTPGEFASAPQSIAELRADKLREASAWGPRDLLISLLRDIDSGKLKATAIVVAIGETEADDPALISSYCAAGCGIVVALGLLSAAAQAVWLARKP